MPEAQPLPPRPRRYQRLLNKAVENPRSVLRDGRTRKPWFCLPYFDLCDAIAYERPEEALVYAATARELGQRSGDAHLANLSLGVEVNALIARAQWEDAEAALQRQETPAAGCCESCLADHLHRRADLALEHRRTDDALLWLREAGPGLAGPGLEGPGLADGAAGAAPGRALILQAMGRHFRGENGRAAASSVRGRPRPRPTATAPPRAELPARRPGRGAATPPRPPRAGPPRPASAAPSPRSRSRGWFRCDRPAR